MIKIKIMIEGCGFLSIEEPYVIIELPAVPRVGDYIYLDGKSESALERKAKKTLRIASYYFPKWFYGESSKGCNKRSDLKNLSFSDAIRVTRIAFASYSDIVDVYIDQD